tara:strand:- start:6715 stop:6972 length:258 start_codon:yes stop_codon:yes gene_type:complete
MTEQENVVEATESEAPQLSLKDISTFVQIIDICSKRGGFEGPELEAIGSLRNRTVAFLNAVAPAEGEVYQGDLPVEDEDEASAEA